MPEAQVHRSGTPSQAPPATLILTGTSGFSYKEWKGTFYPAKLSGKKMLGYYSERLPAVEINNTFYKTPKPEMLAGWASQVPEDFRFVLKAPRKITHFKKMGEASGEEAGFLLGTASAMGSKLGSVFFQFPPNAKKDLSRLADFLESMSAVADRPRIEFEFRHPSWFDDDIYDMLRGFGATMVFADVAGEPAPELVPTANWGHLRLRRQEYSDADLEAWRDRVHQAGWQDAYVFFKHEDAGAGPALATRFMALG